MNRVNYRVSEIQGAILGKQLKRLSIIIKKLQEYRKVMAEVFTGHNKFKIIRNNDESGAVAIPVIYKRPLAASSLLESGRHVYTNWKPQRTLCNKTQKNL